MLVKVDVGRIVTLTPAQAAHQPKSYRAVTVLLTDAEMDTDITGTVTETWNKPIYPKVWFSRCPKAERDENGVYVNAKTRQPIGKVRAAYIVGQKIWYWKG